MNEIVKSIPIVVLKGMTILPYMVIHFDVNRKQSVKSLEYAIKNNRQILMITQRDTETDITGVEDIYEYGTIAEIKEVVRLRDKTAHVLVQGIRRARLLDCSFNSEYTIGDVEVCDTGTDYSDAGLEARLELLKEMFKHFLSVSGRNKGNVTARIDAMHALDELIYIVLAECSIDYEERQYVLELESIEEQYDAVCDIVCSEIDIESIKKELEDNVKARVDKGQKEYILREQLSAIKEELGEGEDPDECDRFREAVANLNAPEQVKDKLLKEIKRYDSFPFSSSEAALLRSYIETLLELPWNNMSEDNPDVINAQKILDEDHYGLTKVKERIVEFIAVKSLTGKGSVPVVCLVGPPGTGKTSIAASVARALNRKYVRVCLGGVRDEAEIRGHRKTYVGAMPGRIVNGLKQAKTANPLMLLDEIDKVGTDSRGDTASALLEVLDTEQNVAFRDHFVELPIDLSNVLFIATANDIGSIPKPLLDRMEVIELNSYTSVEKFHIAKEHLVAKQIKACGLTKSQISFSDDALCSIIDNYTKEAGVRELERQIGRVCRRVAKLIAEGTVKRGKKITTRSLKDILGTPKYDDEQMTKESTVGMVKGLAWTSVGGTTLDVEAVTMPGKGNVTITGKLGDVMKESAQVALGYVRSIAQSYGIEPENFEKKDVYIHFPEGATPKDGPSAGITVTLAILSAFTGRAVRNDIAMTGEITLHGNVLAIGGLKEKTLAAKAIGIRKVIVPYTNRRDVEEFEPEITDGMEFSYVKKMDEVIKLALLD